MFGCDRSNLVVFFNGHCECDAVHIHLWVVTKRSLDAKRNLDVKRDSHFEWLRCESDFQSEGVRMRSEVSEV